MHVDEQLKHLRGQINYCLEALCNNLEDWERNEYQVLLDEHLIKIKDTIEYRQYLVSKNIIK